MVFTQYPSSKMHTLQHRKKTSIANIKKFVMVVTEIDIQNASVSSSEEIVMMLHAPTFLCTMSFREKSKNTGFFLN